MQHCTGEGERNDGRQRAPILRAFDWLFRNRRTGRITIAQFPDLALTIFLVTVVLRWFVTSGTAHTALGWIGVAALAWWAVDEVLRGVNPWRRLLGLGGLAFAVAGLVSLLS
jgi:hypothetical protein